MKEALEELKTMNQHIVLDLREIQADCLMRQLNL
jgi:hypothetical protein